MCAWLTPRTCESAAQSPPIFTLRRTDDRAGSPAWDGAVALTAALVAIEPEHRLDALALACDAAVKTNFWTKGEFARV